MPLFKVWAKSTTYYTVEIEADTRVEAEEIAERADGHEFDCPDPYGGEWSIVPEYTEVPDPQCEDGWIEVDDLPKEG